MKTTKRHLKVLTLALIGLYGSLTTYAATITSTSTGGLSNVNGTWVGDVLPSATDNVIIAARATVSLGANTTWANLTVNGALVMQAKDLTIDDLSGSGTISTSNTSALSTTTKSNTIFSGTLSGKINFTKYGTFSLTLSGTNTYTLVTTVSAGTLPVGLLFFKAEVNGSGIDLTWVTTSEINNDYFTVEKSKDEENFELVTVVKGAGNSADSKSYNAVDSLPYLGSSYYRLKQTDYDGKFTYSQLVFVGIDSDLSFSVFPNPVSSGQIPRVDLSNFSEGGEVHISVYDAWGGKLSSKSLIVDSSGNYIVAVDCTEKLIPGVYIITIASDKSLVNQRLIVN